MKQPGLDQRHRDKDGEISRKHGNTRISTLRNIYGPNFASGFAPNATVADVLHALNETSLTKLVHDHEAEHLAGKISQHS